MKEANGVSCSARETQTLDSRRSRYPKRREASGAQEGTGLGEQVPGTAPQTIQQRCA